MYMDCLIELGGEYLYPHPSGALWWPDAGTLIVADLHLEKGTSFARHGSLLPPYDTRATLARLAAVIAELSPARVVALGDSFHDRDAAGRLDPRDAETLASLVTRQNWIWIAGNHDPMPNPKLGGTIIEEEVALGPIVLRHAAAAGHSDGGEISGHYHPKANVSIHGRRVSRRCFVGDAARLIMPAFGSYAGGLDIRDQAIAGFFPGGFTAYLLGQRRVSPIPSQWFGFQAAAALAAACG